MSPHDTEPAAAWSYAQQRELGSRPHWLERNLLARAALRLILAPLALLGGRRLRESYPGTAGRITGARESGDLLGAIEIALDGCARFRDQPMVFFTRGVDAFWMCLAQAATAAEKIGASAPWDRIIDLAEHQPGPAKGLYAAEAMLAIAGYLSGVGDRERAAIFARLSADATWLSSRVFAAWLGLKDSQFDTRMLLTEAIALEPRWRETLARDPAFAKWPGLDDVLNHSIN
ncbi:MAG TPA: hypothetical protein VGO62_17840 [Myxococcota bacterium]|jgi:hypothetical protein